MSLEKCWYTVEQCPAYEECNCTPSKAKVWGWTPAECKKALLHHLTHSAKHYMDTDKANTLVAETMLVHFERSDSENEEVLPKRQRMTESRGTCRQVAEHVRRAAKLARDGQEHAEAAARAFEKQSKELELAVAKIAELEC
jgi:hypothetical protein